MAVKQSEMKSTSIPWAALPTSYQKACLEINPTNLNHSPGSNYRFRGASTYVQDSTCRNTDSRGGVIGNTRCWSGNVHQCSTSFLDAFCSLHQEVLKAFSQSGYGSLGCFHSVQWRKLCAEIGECSWERESSSLVWCGNGNAAGRN